MDYDEIREKIKSKGYEPTAPYVRPILFKPVTPEDVLNCLKASDISMTHAQAVAQAEETKRKAVAESNTAYTLYNKQLADAMEQFEEDLYSASGVKGHPILPYLFHQAWQTGHSYGLSEVLCHFQDLVDRFEPLLAEYNFVLKSK
jgi:hypothetical protein